jgi:hypothetical protein
MLLNVRCTPKRIVSVMGALLEGPRTESMPCPAAEHAAVGKHQRVRAIARFYF